MIWILAKGCTEFMNMILERQKHTDVANVYSKYSTSACLQVCITACVARTACLPTSVSCGSICTPVFLYTSPLQQQTVDSQRKVIIIHKRKNTKNSVHSIATF